MCVSLQPLSIEYSSMLLSPGIFQLGCEQRSKKRENLFVIKGGCGLVNTGSWLSTNSAFPQFSGDHLSFETSVNRKS